MCIKDDQIRRGPPESHPGQPGRQQTEQRYRAITELTSDYAYLLRIDPDGRVIYEWVDERFSEISGYTLEALQCQGGWTNLIHDEGSSMASQRQPRWLAGQSDVSKFRIRTQCGEEHWVRDYTCPVRDGNQVAVVHVYGAGQDIINHHRLEEPLWQAQKMEAIGRLAGGIAQNVNNGLQVISGYSDLLLRRLS